MRLVALVVAAMTLLVASGCGGDDEKNGSGSGSVSDGAVEVRETEFALNPANPTIERPGQVEFKIENAGEVAHALEVEGPGGEKRSGNIQPGQSASLKVDLDKPGRYEWYCPIGLHREQGMEGEITVAGGGAQSGGGATTDTTETQTETTETETTETDTTRTDESGGSGSGSGGGGSGGGGY